MSIDKGLKSRITKGDILLIIGIVILTATLFIYSFSGSDTLKAQIYLDGESVKEIDLSEVKDSYTVIVGQCELLIENDGVTFLSSKCSDKLCVKRGKLTKKGDAMACVPQKVVVSIKSTKGKQPDIVTY